MSDEKMNDVTDAEVPDAQPLVETQPQVTVEQREGDDTVQQVDLVHLPALLSDEFGISQSIAREQIALGMVEIDGVEAEPRKLDFLVSELDGKVIEISGRDRGFKMTYDHERHMSRKDSFR